MLANSAELLGEVPSPLLSPLSSSPPVPLPVSARLPPLLTSPRLSLQPLHFVLRVEAARGLLDAANRNVFVRFNFSDDDTSHVTPRAEGKHAAPQFDFRHQLHMPVVSEQLLRYLQKDAICFDVWGEQDEVQDAERAGGAAAMELPPEVFEFFVSIDVHEARDDLGYDFEQADMQPSLTRDGKPGFVLTQV